MKKNIQRKKGQAMVEYLIIVAVVAVAAFVIFGLFGDVIRKKMSGAISTLDSDLGSDAQNNYETSSKDVLIDMDETGTGNN